MYPISNSTFVSSVCRKPKLKDLKPKMTSSRLSLVDSSNDSFTFQTHTVCDTVQRVKKLKRSSTRKVLLKLKKKVLTSTIIDNISKSNISSLSAIQEEQVIDTYLTNNNNDTLSLIDLDKLNCPLFYVPKMHVKHIDRLDAHYLKDENYGMSQFDDYKIWII